MNGDGAPMISIVREVVDEKWHDEGMVMVSSADSIAPSREGGERPELVTASVTFGSRRHARFAAEEIQRRGQGDAHGQEGEIGTLNERRYPLLSVESTKSAALLAGLQ
jgi:hypothetical protein